MRFKWGSAVRSLLVVGGGLAGLSASRAARDLGFDGPVVLLGDEPHRPYDRPPLSKDYLAGRAGRSEIGLEAPQEHLDLDWHRGTATGLTIRTRTGTETGATVVTADGDRLSGDGVVLATGAYARNLPNLPDDLANLLVLRTVDDADRLRALLSPGVRLVVVGAGLIGSEVAATATGLGCAVTVLTNEHAPLENLYGVEVAPRLTALHAAHGVELRAGASVLGVERVDDRATTVLLADGSRLPADVVLVAVGSAAGTAWLEDSGLDLGVGMLDGVRCDRHGRVLAGGEPVPGIVATGDCAAWWDPHLQRHHRAQHWTDANERPVRAVAALLGVEPPRRRPYLPYFWSDQYEHRVLMAGYASLADEVVLEHVGTDGDPGFVAVYRRAGEPVAALALDRAREFTRWRKTLTATLGQLPELPTLPAAAPAPSAAAPSPV